MEVLKLDGKKYVKATLVARELGYTSDYVGQLCRSGKVDAHLVGRSWYVDRESIRDHKSSRYRSSKKKTQDALKDSLENLDEGEPVKIQIASSSPQVEESSEKSQHFYGRMSVPKVKYDEDGSELIPNLTQKERGVSQKLEVRPAGAEEVKVKNPTSSYSMKASPLPNIRFEGELPIEDADNSTMDDTERAEGGNLNTEASTKSTSKSTLAAEQVQVPEATDKKRKTLHPTDESPKDMNVPIHRQQVAFTDRLAALESSDLDVSQRGERFAVSGSESTINFQQQGTQSTLMYIAASALIAFSLSIAVLLTEQRYIINSESQSTPSLSFNGSVVLDLFKRFK